MKEKKEHKALGKATKGFAIAASIIVMIPCIAIVTFTVLSLAEVLPFGDDTVHTYVVKFIDEDEETKEITTYATFNVHKGEEFSYTEKPTKAHYKFIGWDSGNDKIPDIIPERIYFNMTFRAIWIMVED